MFLYNAQVCEVGLHAFHMAQYMFSVREIELCVLHNVLNEQELQ